ncbi:MAG: ATP-binding cassette domain-containing protein, partial [Clostridiales bacterium]
GEQQRVAIARALVNRPSILVADEPTGNLDPQNSDELMEILTQINARGTTIIMATHAKEIVNKMHKRVIMLHQGHVAYDEMEGVYDEAALI